ncbi:MAG TPA: ABC transporter permease [Bryobacteraceae bacterium]|jgi:putative ABC transport system permease protein|nr:ABC transporter permease [Bryobacteraceae bacterium]
MTNHLIDDLRLAIRGFRKTPGVTAVIVLALALGIGVNSSCFVYISGLLLHPFPYPQLDQIMTVWESPANQPGDRGAVAPANFIDIKERIPSFAALSAFRPWNANLSGIGDPERVQACQVTPEFFAVLGIQPALGRTLEAEDAAPGTAGTIVISRGFWSSRLGSSPEAIGKTVSLNGAAYTIVGVMPEEFNFPLEAEMWVPLTFTAAELHDRATHSVSILGRLKPGVPVTQVRAEMATLGRRLASDHPATNENRAFQTLPLLELVDSYSARFLLTLQVTAGFVLLLACANVANLFLVRLADRQREIAIRSAMGASRGRIVTQLLVESAVIALISGAIGLDFAAWIMAHRSIPPEVYKFVGGLKTAHVDSTTVLLTIGVSLIAGFLCALPSLSLVLREAASVRLSESLKESGRSGSGGRARSRLRTTLAVFEVTIALILLIGAGAMVRTFQRFLTMKTGFEAADLLTMEIALPQPKYAAATLTSSFYQRLLDGLDRRDAAVTADEAADALFIEGRPEPGPGEPVPALRSVSGRYFETLKLPIIAGRAISPGDDRDHPLAVVLSESLAQQYWPTESPIGRQVRLSKKDPRWLTVVGVCGDTKNWFSTQPEPRAYISFLQSPEADATVYIRTHGDTAQVAAAVREEVHRIDSAQAIFDVKTMEQRIADETSGVRAASNSMVMYAFIGLFLAASGIYGVISYSVARRTHEIGVRMALGADRGTVLRMTLRDAVLIGAIGLGIGVPIAFAMIRTMSSVLYGIIQLDALTFGALTVILAICAVAAGYVPAWRASRLDPMTALRNE